MVMGALDTALGALGGHAYGLGAISGGAIPRPGGEARVVVPADPSVTFRFDLLEDLTAFGTHNSGNRGQWGRDASGSTGSSNTGPGTNSSGGYVYVESSSSTIATIREQSRVDLTVVDMWPAPTNRVLRLRICVQGNFIQTAEGLRSSPVSTTPTRSRSRSSSGGGRT